MFRVAHGSRLRPLVEQEGGVGRDAWRWTADGGAGGDSVAANQEARNIVSNSTGGTSIGDPDAGHDEVDYAKTTPPTTAGKVGAGILTVVIGGLAVGMFGFMSI
ncbi:hypothetical protein V490_05759 [Pseudogymnoascus sp. VKM F-3557]|nr:hypothetical protein V490_05759 [Pseudogymnoascus sp. VKM F-3557]